MPIINGTPGDDVLNGGAENDEINGLEGDDTLDGGGGRDTMSGGTGNDIYYVDRQDDFVTENPNEGNDTVISTASSYTLGAHIERLILYTGALNGTGSSQANVLVGNGLVNWLSGEDGNDVILGDAGDDVLFGGSGQDNLNGGLGADTMAGGTADDVFIVDTVDDQIVEYTGEGNDVVYTSGNYTLRMGVAVEVLLTDAPAATTAINLSGNEFGNAITGNAGANILLGNAGNDALIGLDGNDTLDGGAGMDVANGGFGDDVYIVDSADDVVIEAAGQGRDLLFTGASFSLRTGDSIELLLTSDQAGTAAINLSGNEFDNIVQGNQGSNILSGNAGADVLLGFGGDDFLNGGSGADITTGGLGDDIYFVDALDDIVLENANEGRDIVYATANYILRSGVSVEFLLADPQSSTAAINLTGNEIANNIQGNAGVNILFGGDGDDLILGHAGNDTINGNGGADYMIGGLGDDVFFVDSTGDVVSELIGQGRDLVYTSVNFALGPNDSVELLIADPATGSAQINLTGNLFANQLQGNAGNNILSGGGGDDVILGNGGDDSIDGGSGNDTMIGGAGNDTYFVDSSADVVTELAGEGTDLVYAAISFGLAASSEVEELAAAPIDPSAYISLTGSNGANTLRGHAGANLLSGGGGNDVLLGLGGDDYLRGGAGADNMAGGTGNDIYEIDDAADALIELAGEGVDRIYTTVSYVLPAGVEIEWLVAEPQSSTAAINLTGNEFANQIQGNAGSNVLLGGGGDDILLGLGGNDTLRGGVGADRMEGGVGDDIYWVEDAGDIVIEDQFNGGNDLIVAFIDYVLPWGLQVESIYGDGGSFQSLNLTGNQWANNIQGTQGFNILSGGDGDDSIAALSGNDQIDGGAGNDLLNGGLGADTFYFRAPLSASNIDIIADFVSGVDRIGLSTVPFAGLTAGALAAHAFVVGTAAQDADDRVVYDQATGRLFYDADGNGAGAAVQIATLTGAPPLTASDFIIV